MSPMTTLFSAAKAAPAASDAQSAPASINIRLRDFIPFLPIHGSSGGAPPKPELIGP
jgi:hypothetical protein